MSEVTAAQPGLAGSTGSQEPEAPGLWANTDFKIIVVGQGLSALGSAVTLLALPLLVMSMTGSKMQMALVGALAMVPRILFGSIAGGLADRWDQRLIMLYTDLGRAVLLGLIPLVALLGGPVMPVVFIVSVLSGVLEAFFQAAFVASIPNLVGRNQIAQANSYMAAVAAAGYTLGPAIAGLLTEAVGPARTVAIDALSFLVSGLSLLFVRRALRTTRSEAPASLWREIGEGVRFILQRPVLRDLISFETLVVFIGAPVLTALTVYVTVDSHQSPSLVGFTISVFGIGSILGFVLAARLARGRLGLLILAANAITGVADILLPLSKGYLMALPALAAGAFYAVMSTLIRTGRMMATPNELMGRVQSSAEVLCRAVMPLGLFLGGVLMDLTSGGTALQVLGGLLIAVSVVFLVPGTIRRA